MKLRSKRIVLLVLVILCGALMLYLPQNPLNSAQQISLKTNRHHNPIINEQTCRFVYFDLGTNRGVQIRKLYERWFYPDAKILPYYDKFFGNVTKRYRRQDVCSFGFEANPRHIERLKHIESSYRKKGLNVSIFNYAVSNRSHETVPIYSKQHAFFDLGAGLTDRLTPNRNIGMIKYDVETIDIARFIEGTIISLKPWKVFMKMDIEGSEYIVLPHLLERGLLCKATINQMVIEMHPLARDVFHSDLTSKIFREKLENQSCDPTLVAEVDDETYIGDVNIDPAW